jgi:hypothetical protein
MQHWPAAGRKAETKTIARGSGSGRMQRWRCPAAGRKTGMRITTTIVARGGGGGGRMQLWRQHSQTTGTTTIIARGAGSGDEFIHDDILTARTELVWYHDTNSVLWLHENDIINGEVHWWIFSIGDGILTIFPFLIWAGDCVLRTFAICMHLLPYFSYSCIHILCSSCIHLPLVILLIEKLASATFLESKEARIKIKSQWQAIVMPSSQWNVQ